MNTPRRSFLAVLASIFVAPRILTKEVTADTSFNINQSGVAWTIPPNSGYLDRGGNLISGSWDEATADIPLNIVKINQTFERLRQVPMVVCMSREVFNIIQGSNNG